jgi:hypothetical protein
MNIGSDVMDIIEKWDKDIPFVLIMLPVRTRKKLRVKLAKRGLTLEEFLTAFANGSLKLDSRKE